VNRRGERNAGARHLGEFVTPETGCNDDFVGLDGPAVRLDRLNLAALDFQIEYLRVREYLVAVGGLFRTFAHYLARPKRVTGPCVGLVQSALDDVLVDERHLFFDFLGADNPPFLTPRLGACDLPFHLLEPFLGPCNLDPLAESELIHLVVLSDGIIGEERHLLRVFQRHQEVRRVSGRSAGVG